MNPFKIITHLDSYINAKKIKLVYLHIEKSAGTSQRIFLNERYGENQVFWYGINSNVKTIDLKEIKNSYLLGGHRFHDFYSNPRFIYLAVVRDPIDSIMSLFSYFISQPHHMANWGLKQGFDSSSLENSLNHCKAFRQRISDHQCRYFTKDKLFNSALKTLKNNQFMVGCLSKLELFNSVLFGSMGIKQASFPKTNARKKGLNDRMQLNTKGKDLLIDLLKNDILLYDYLMNECNGLFNSTQDNTWNTLRNNLS